MGVRHVRTPKSVYDGVQVQGGDHHLHQAVFGKHEPNSLDEKVDAKFSANQMPLLTSNFNVYLNKTTQIVRLLDMTTPP